MRVEGLELRVDASGDAVSDGHDEQADVVLGSLQGSTGTILSSKVNLPHIIDFGASCGANLVTQRPRNEGK